MRGEIDWHRGKAPHRNPEINRHAREQRIRVYMRIKPDGNKATPAASTATKDSRLAFKGSTISLLRIPKSHQERPFSGKASSGDSTSPQSVLPSSSSPTLDRCTKLFELSCDGIISPQANQEEVYSKVIRGMAEEYAFSTANHFLFFLTTSFILFIILVLSGWLCVLNICSLESALNASIPVCIKGRMLLLLHMGQAEQANRTPCLEI